MPALPPATTLSLGALLHPDDCHGLDALLEQAARTLQAEGWPVGGLVHRSGRYANGARRMELHDLFSAQSFELSQNLGAAARGCCLNPEAFAQASGVLRQALSDGVALVVINRFGAAEGTGGGFASEFAACVQAGVPVLTAVAARHADAWERFTGGLHTPLPADAGALAQWARKALQAAPAALAAPGNPADTPAP